MRHDLYKRSVRETGAGSIGFVGRVRYGDNVEWARPTIGAISPVTVGFIKRSRFAHEEEVRIAVVRRASANFSLKVNLNQLVDRVTIAPNADALTELAIRALFGRVLPRVEIVRSALDKAPS